jgi:hypothetical protein
MVHGAFSRVRSSECPSTHAFGETGQFRITAFWSDELGKSYPNFEIF